MTRISSRARRRSQLAALVAVLAASLSAPARAHASDAFDTDPLLGSDVIQIRLARRTPFVAQAFAVVRNASDRVVTGPLRVVVDVNRDVLNADGRTADGLPFFDVCADASCAVAAGGTSLPVEIRFRVPTLLERILRGVRRLSLRTRAEYIPFRMQLLHSADVDGVGPLANVRNYSGLLDRLRSQMPDETLFVTSGDNYIPGPTYAAGADPSLAPLLGVPGVGRADITFLNLMGLQASAVGNHDLDEGLAVFGGIIGIDMASSGFYPGAQFPYLSSNIDFSGTPVAPLLAPNARPGAAGSIARSATFVVGGQTVGVVGASSPTFPQITNTGNAIVRPPLLSTGMIDVPALAAEIQTAVDELTTAGVDKVVLVAHMQVLDVERALAPLLRDVDIIVGGGSNTILADADDLIRPGDVVQGTYPELYTSPSGATVALVNTDGDYTYLGRLVARFDLAGRVIEDSLDPTINGAYATDDMSLLLRFGTIPPANPGVSALADAVTGVIQGTEGNVLGFTSVYLDGRRPTVRTQESNLGNLTADANLFVAKQADPTVTISLKNGGGIRADIGDLVFPPGSSDPADLRLLPPAAIPGVKPEGGISQFDITSALSFNNTLTLVTLSASQVRALFEHGLGFPGVGIVQEGRFPQAAGVRVSFDPAAPFGSRIVDLTVVDEDNGAVIAQIVSGGALVSSGSFRIVTLNFLAAGGDGYPFPDLTDPALDVLDLAMDPSSLPVGVSDFAAPGSEQDALAEYLAARFATSDTAFAQPEVPRAQDQRIVFLGQPQAP